MNMCAGVCVQGVLLIEYNQMKSHCSTQMGVEFGIKVASDELWTNQLKWPNHARQNLLLLQPDVGMI